MRVSWIVVGLVCSGCMATSGVIDPFSYAPKSSSAFYGQKLDLNDVTRFSPDHPLTLAEIVDIALRNTPTTKLTWAKARAASAQYGQAQSPDFPTISGNYSYNRSKTTYPPEFGSPRFVQYLTEWGPQLELTYTILDFGQTRFSTESARQALLFADYTHNRQIQTVLQQVTSDYYNYLNQLEQLKANEADLVTAQTTFNAAKAGFEAGVKDVSDFLQAQTQLLQSDIQLITQRQNVINARAGLLADMGLDSNQMIEIEKLPDVPPIDQMNQTADELVALALQKRADLIAADAQVKSQEAAVDAAWRQFWPTLTVDLTADHLIAKPGGDLNVNYTSVVALNFPIFSGFSTLNSLRQARAQKSQAEASRRQTELSVIQEVVTSHSQVKTSFETLQMTDTLLKTTEEQYQVALARYQSGVGTILELVSAQSSLIDARSSQVNSTNQWLTSLVNLSYAAGTLEPPQKGAIR